MCTDLFHTGSYRNIKGKRLELTFPCGKCQECYTARSNQWFVRIHNEMKRALTAHFVTLTYELPLRSFNGYFIPDKRHLQLYLKRLRRNQGTQLDIDGNPIEIKYYAVSEYGETYQRPHFHMIIFNVQNENQLVKCWTNVKTNSYCDLYKLGTVDVKPVEEGCIKYVTGYIGKRIGIPLTDDDDRPKEFSLMSKGLGENYANDAGQFHRTSDILYTSVNGITYPLGRYYKDKIFGARKILMALKREYEAGLLSHEYYYRTKSGLEYQMHCITKHHTEEAYDFLAERNAKKKQSFPSVQHYYKNELDLISQRKQKDFKPFKRNNL